MLIAAGRPAGRASSDQSVRGPANLEHVSILGRQRNQFAREVLEALAIEAKEDECVSFTIDEDPSSTTWTLLSRALKLLRRRSENLVGFRRTGSTGTRARTPKLHPPRGNSQRRAASSDPESYHRYLNYLRKTTKLSFVSKEASTPNLGALHRFPTASNIAPSFGEDNAVAYCSLKEVKIGTITYSSTTYVTAPDNSAKGVIHNIPSYDSPADIERSLERNTPRVLQARRLGETASVLIVFEGKSVPYYVNYRNTTYRCLLYRRKIEFCENCYKVGHRKDICPTPDDKRCSKCGTLAPEGSHECTLRCAICGGEHMSGSKACQHRFHAPQRAARRQQTANEEATPPTSRPSIGRQSRSKDRRSAAESPYARLIGQKADRGDSNSAGGEENQRPFRGSTTTKVTWASVTDPSTHQRANRDNENQMLRAEIMQLRQMLQRQNALIEQLQREQKNMKRLETRLTPLEGTVQQMQQQCRPSRFESPSRSTTPQGMDPIRLSEPIDHYILSTTIPTSGYKHKKRGVRITEWDRLRKIRQEIAPTTIDNIEEWTQQLQDDVETYTQDIPEEADAFLQELQTRYIGNQIPTTVPDYCGSPNEELDSPILEYEVLSRPSEAQNHLGTGSRWSAKQDSTEPRRQLDRGVNPIL
ncbi:hypothetical protein HPB47_006435 [Ixodes persulcatus]|uniref:Uncharacterized protein n=1 Tax=Ixodes persulcatus TaxID=34615 RepID=A0AC60PAI3_IXOPE|nr:hypothetical protein HPB47_006435 [Ixodes persulcatus]